MSTRDLREKASAADMRPPFALALVWTSEYGSGYALETPERYLPVICGVEEDAEFIAAANPDRVLALLDDLAAAEAKVARVEAVAGRWTCDCGDSTHHRAACRSWYGAVLREVLDADDDTP